MKRRSEGLLDIMTVNDWERDIDQAFEQALSFLRENDGRVYLWDPNDERRVAENYGESHLCAALLLRARRTGETRLKDVALRLLDGFMENSPEIKAGQGHADFNNFAITLVYEELVAQGENAYAEKALNWLYHVKDSRNKTVNWLPMRAYFNLFLYEKTQNEKFLRCAVDALNAVKNACYDDGLFEDLVPKGRSFNLQYCVSTAAALQMVYRRFDALSDRLPRFDLEKTASALYALVLPDGDVNYMGRGCNQIFAWGPWLYFTANYVENDVRERSRQFLAERFATARDNCNLMLNSYSGKSRTLWWDYHHYTVYMAHFLLWRELANDSRFVEPEKIDKLTAPTDSGLEIHKGEGWFAVTFNGRSHYLIEKGPALVALWTKEFGSVFKCGHAPSGKKFSNLYFNPLTAYFSCLGPIELSEKPKKMKGRIARFLGSIFNSKEISLKIKPLFGGVKFSEKNGLLTIEFRVEPAKTKDARRAFVVPSYVPLDDDSFTLEESANGTNEFRRCELRRVGALAAQYGDMNVYMTNANDAVVWKLSRRVRQGGKQ